MRNYSVSDLQTTGSHEAYLLKSKENIEHNKLDSDGNFAVVGN